MERPTFESYMAKHANTPISTLNVYFYLHILHRKESKWAKDLIDELPRNWRGLVEGLETGTPSLTDVGPGNIKTNTKRTALLQALLAIGDEGAWLSAHNSKLQQQEPVQNKIRN